jgi:hypothetical protein
MAQIAVYYQLVDENATPYQALPVGRVKVNTNGKFYDVQEKVWELNKNKLSWVDSTDLQVFNTTEECQAYLLDKKGGNQAIDLDETPAVEKKKH